MSKSKRQEIKRRYETELQVRQGVPTAIISVETIAEDYDGRGYAGQTSLGYQVLVVPVQSLGNLLSAITDSLTYDLTADVEERYDLVNEAQPRIGLYAPSAIGTQIQPAKEAEFYTLAEARYATQAFKGKGGYTLRHLKDAESGDPVRFATSVIETL